MKRIGDCDGGQLLNVVGTVIGIFPETALYKVRFNIIPCLVIEFLV